MLSKKYQIIIFLFLILYGSLFVIDAVFGLTYRNYCVNTSYLQKSMDFTYCDSSCSDYNFTQLLECEFGCDNVTHVCRQAQIYEYASFFQAIVIILLIIGIIIYLFRRK